MISGKYYSRYGASHFEGDLSVVDESNYEKRQYAVLYKENVDNMNSCINNVVDSINLKDLVDEYHRLNGSIVICTISKIKGMGNRNE